jgi:hypothetical protein
MKTGQTADSSREQEKIILTPAGEDLVPVTVNASSWPTRQSQPGQIVAALVDSKSTLKTFTLRNGRPCRIPSEEFVTQSVAGAIIRQARH